MTKITVSYRRNDSDAITGRIFDRLVAHYGADAVFRDIDNIPPGIDFRKHISGALASTDILLAIVGPQWTGRTSDGNVRIQQVTDLVRVEVETALRKDIPVVPVLVGNATMPPPTDLPDGLQDFPFRHAVKVDALEDFEDHVRRFIGSVDRLLKTQVSSAQQEAEPHIVPTAISEKATEGATNQFRLPTAEGPTLSEPVTVAQLEQKGNAQRAEPIVQTTSDAVPDNQNAELNRSDGWRPPRELIIGILVWAVMILGLATVAFRLSGRW